MGLSAPLAIGKAAAGAAAKGGILAAYGVDGATAVAFGLQGLAANLAGTFFPPFALLWQGLSKYAFKDRRRTYSVWQRDNLALLGLGGAAQYFLRVECNNQGIPVWEAAKVMRSHARKQAWVERGIDDRRIYVDDAGRFEFLDPWPDRHTALERSLQGSLGLAVAPVIGVGDPLERELAQEYFGYRVDFSSGRAEHLKGYYDVLLALGQPLPVVDHWHETAAEKHARFHARPFRGGVLPFGVDLVIDGEWHLQSRIGYVAEDAGDKDTGLMRDTLGEPQLAFADGVVVELGPMDVIRRRLWQDTGEVVIQAQRYYKQWAPEVSVVEPSSRTEGGWLSSLSSFLSSLIRGIADIFRSLFNGAA